MDSAAKKFLNFVNKTGSPFHCVEACKEMLKKAGFEHLKENVTWNLKAGGKYYVTRNSSAIMAFAIGRHFSKEYGGFLIFAGHTDSPCLKIRPCSNIQGHNTLQLGVETYGGGLWHTWFDRELSLAGKVVYQSAEGNLVESLFRINKPILMCPNLAIHLKEERNNNTINNENHLRPIMAMTPTPSPTPTPEPQDSEEKKAFERICKPLMELICKEVGCKPAQVVDVDACLYDYQPGSIWGLNEEFLSSARLDNHVSTFCGVDGLINACEKNENSESDVSVAVSFDHEECGSESWTGANSACMETWFRRIGDIVGKETDVLPLLLSRSILFSADMAHGLHPNYAEKHQAEHRPFINSGVVIKFNGNQRYTSHALTAALVRQVAARAKGVYGDNKPGVPVQNFVVRNDSPCGSTIGPMLSAKLGIRSVDIGIPQWAMHSIRETCGAQDIDYYTRFATSVFTNFRQIDSHLQTLDQ